MSSEAKIRIFPDPILRTPCQVVRDFGTVELTRLISDLHRIMKKQTHGIGLAAPQIGSGLQVALVDVTERDPKGQKLCLINPLIREFWEETTSREGCMSIPDYRGDIKRYKRILVEWHNEKGRKLQKISEGIEAICIQHEVDHLSGLLFIDRVASLKRDLLPRKIH
ncbi:MAG: peptide deformylase [Candidatus Omnitrophica bacterium]|nr:peptide deformylase [Candidatus Omnitrophota bacterium]